MTDIAMTDDLFFTQAGMERAHVEGLVTNALKGMDDGELFLEYRQSESVTFDDGRVRQASFDTSQGFGLRAVAGEATGFAHAAELSEAAIRRAGAAVMAVRQGHTGHWTDAPARTNHSLYPDDNPLAAMSFDEKVALLAEIDRYARARDPRVRQVSATLGASWQAVQILRPDGTRARA